MLSIITINLNNCLGLELTIASIVSQTIHDFEFIIIDGGSTDGSLELINGNSQYITSWLSEPDSGIYNAMNKGIKVSNGDYLIFLNSGDVLYDENVLVKVFPILGNVDVIYGDLLFLDKDKSWIKRFPDTLTFEYFLFKYLPHPATFIRRKLFDQVGFYNERNKIVSDWEFLLLAVNKFNCSYYHLPLTISKFTLDGLSSQSENHYLIRKEMDQVLIDNFPTILPGYEELFRLREELVTLHEKYNRLQNSKMNRIGRFLRSKIVKRIF